MLWGRTDGRALCKQRGALAGAVLRPPWHRHVARSQDLFCDHPGTGTTLTTLLLEDRAQHRCHLRISTRVCALCPQGNACGCPNDCGALGAAARALLLGNALRCCRQLLLKHSLSGSRLLIGFSHRMRKINKLPVSASRPVLPSLLCCAIWSVVACVEAVQLASSHSKVVRRPF